MTIMNSDLLDKLIMTASEKTWSESGGDDFCVNDYAGGNIDDAYNGGIRDGEIFFAREILDSLSIKYGV